MEGKKQGEITRAFGKGLLAAKITKQARGVGLGKAVQLK